MRDLTDKQHKFVEAFDGNVKRTAEVLGISVSYARKMSKKPHVVDAIQKRRGNQNPSLNALVADRAERQKFWSDVMRGDVNETVMIGRGKQRIPVELPTKIADRLKASEILGRSEGDFLEVEGGSLSLTLIQIYEQIKSNKTPLIPMDEPDINLSEVDYRPISAIKKVSKDGEEAPDGKKGVFILEGHETAEPEAAEATITMKEVQRQPAKAADEEEAREEEGNFSFTANQVFSQ